MAPDDHINKRNTDEGSTSRYVQQKVPNSAGKPVRQVSKISSMPEQGIIDGIIRKVQNVSSLATSVIKGAIKSISASVSTIPVNEPVPTSEKAEYGKVFVFDTKSGHVLLVDETEGNKRILIQHANGSYDSMTDLGDKIEKAKKDKYVFVLGNMIVNIGSDKVEIVSGSTTVEIDGSRSEKIGGHSHVDVSEDDLKKIGGDRVLQAAGDVSNTAGGGIGEKCSGNKDEDIGGDLKVEVNGKADVSINGKYVLEANKVDISGNQGAGQIYGVVNGGCICAFTGKPHLQISENVRASM